MPRLRMKQHAALIAAINSSRPTTAPTTTGMSGNSAEADVVGSAAIEVDNSDGDIVVDIISSEVVMAVLVEPELDGGAVDDEVSDALVGDGVAAAVATEVAEVVAAAVDVTTVVGGAIDGEEELVVGAIVSVVANVEVATAVAGVAVIVVSVDLSTIAVRRIATNDKRTTESVRRKRAVAGRWRAAALAQAH